MNTNLLKKKILFFSLIFFISNAVFSQDIDKKWVLGASVNIVDIRYPNTIKETIDDYFNKDLNDFNMSGTFIKVSVGRYLNNSFSLHLSFSANKIEKPYYYSTNFALANDNFTALDAKIKYDVNNLLGNTKWFDPYLLIGGGYVKIRNDSNVFVSTGYGFNAWLSENFGLNFQSDYNHGIRSFGTDYFQHSAGVIFKPNGYRNFSWRDKN